MGAYKVPAPTGNIWLAAAALPILRCAKPVPFVSRNLPSAAPGYGGGSIHYKIKIAQLYFTICK